jgi:hypothetical protein
VFSHVLFRDVFFKIEGEGEGVQYNRWATLAGCSVIAILLYMYLESHSFIEIAFEISHEKLVRKHNYLIISFVFHLLQKLRKQYFNRSFDISQNILLKRYLIRCWH